MGRDPQGNRNRFLATWRQLAKRYADAPNDVLFEILNEPMAFTHQGASWTGQKDKVGISWNGTAQAREAIERDFAKAQRWAEKHKQPIFLGEFGAYWQFDGDFIVFDMKTQRWVQSILDALIPARK